jgi:hypothetical protein
MDFTLYGIWTLSLAVKVEDGRGRKQASLLCIPAFLLRLESSEARVPLGRCSTKLHIFCPDCPLVTVVFCLHTTFQSLTLRSLPVISHTYLVNATETRE